jgi:uncharacterized protein (DUF885 family)
MKCCSRDQFLLFLISALCLLALLPARASDSVDAKFEKLAKEFVETHYAFRPIGGAGLGWHQYDGKFVLPDAAAVAAERARLQRFETAFAALNAQTLAPRNRHDLHLLRAAVANSHFALEIQRAYSRNPMAYVEGAGDLPAIDVSLYLKRDFKPLPARIRDVSAILRQAPSLLALARANLEPVLPRAFIETAIESARGTASFLSNDVSKAAATVRDSKIRREFEQASRPAVAAYNDYAEWLKREKFPKADNSYALGQQNYVTMLKSEWIDLSPEQILEAGLRELAAEQRRFAEAARLINPNKKPMEVFREMQADHPTAANLIPDTRKNLEAIRQFLIDRRILTIPSKVRPRVEETLPPFRASSFASMDTPGPFEKKATEAYYYVTPVEPDWPPQQAEEWLTAFNYYALDVTSIHEAYPGHYLQFLTLNASPLSTTAKIFGSYPFTEGWAHYTEQMMLDEGYGGPMQRDKTSPAEQIRAAKYRLEQSDEALLRLCRLCCSIKLHCQGMTVEQATRFFMENCYYEEKPANSEAKRGTYDPGYLYYTLGKLMILKLRKDWQAQEGSRFSLKRFHDEFLRHGAPPIPLLRQIMLKDASRWPELL